MEKQWRLTPTQQWLAAAHQWMVPVAARRLIRSRECGTWDDLVSDGYFGLLRAAVRYDPSRGVLFRTFARPFIVGEILEGFRSRLPGGRSGRRIQIVSMASDGALDAGLEDMVAGPDDTAAAAMQALDKEWIAEMMQRLSDRERFIIEETILQQKSLKEVSGELGVGESRVCQIKKQALAMLRSEVNSLNEQCPGL